MKIIAPKGTYDILPEETRRWRALEACFAEVCERFGFGELRTPTFEATRLFQRSVGDSTDVVQKEMYSFEDRGGRSITLRPEGTAGVVRAYLEHGMASYPSPVKIFYQITCFRYEKMQKGRMREFHQMGVELFGPAAPMADMEVIALLRQFFEALGLDDLRLKLNSIGCPTCRPAYLEKLKAYLAPQIEKACGDCQRRFESNPMRVLDCKVEGCERMVQGAPLQADCLCEACSEHLAGLRALLEANQIPYDMDPMIVRGLDYYTRTVFEFVSEAVGTQGTICGGGRYDGLMEQMGGQPTPAVGFALGVERLCLELESRGVWDAPKQALDLYLLSFEQCQGEAMVLANRLRSLGLRVEVDLMERSMKAQWKHANRLEARHALVLGPEELQENCGKLKRMSDGVVRVLALDALGATLQAEKES